jgi:hypothetical protein
MSIIHSSIQVEKRKPTAELLYYAGYIRYILILHAEKFSYTGVQRKPLGVMTIMGQAIMVKFRLFILQINDLRQKSEGDSKLLWGFQWRGLSSRYKACRIYSL